MRETQSTNESESISESISFKYPTITISWSRFIIPRELMKLF